MLLPLPLSLLPASAATDQMAQVAQTITPASDGIGTEVMVDGNRFTITDGTLRGTNLFHSFEQLGLSREQVADFQASAEVQNIVGRIVGGDESTIDGLLRVTGSSANLFLVNPAGMVFGPNASFDIRGSFTASTSDRLSTDENWITNWEEDFGFPPSGAPIITVVTSDRPFVPTPRFSGDTGSIDSTDCGYNNGTDWENGPSTEILADSAGEQVPPETSLYSCALLRVIEGALLQPCSVSVLTVTQDGRYVLSGCEP